MNDLFEQLLANELSLQSMIIVGPNDSIRPQKGSES